MDARLRSGFFLVHRGCIDALPTGRATHTDSRAATQGTVSQWHHPRPRPRPMLRPALQLAAVLLSLMTATTALADGQYFHKRFAGRIDGRHAFTMDLKNVDGRLTGSYRYAGKRIDLSLSGNIDAAGAFTMDETGSDGQRTGTFTGKVVDDTLDGTWASARGDRHLPVDAHQTSEIVIGSKREILTQAIGTYVLDSISGFGGANGMWDSWRDKGRWKSNISAIAMARREFSDVNLTREDLHRLDSMTVTVDRALATHLSVDGKVLLSIPYRDAGMQYELGRPHDDTAALSPATTVHDEHLYLLARDEIDFVPAMSGRFLPNDHLDVATISYAVVDKTFDVSLQDSNCCSGTVFTFRRKDR
ncbi:DUF4847 domain-containing protein [Burkholderia arboris]|uniref:DUF4847 domain-containing protein n=1 Tax=Burkholderia arboris TaxID=488730 RepID=UPI001F24D142|nr:DUF4847 domain-containing protein [Burkholderia arboris]UTV58024.1 DUF4847 domain-containing protein [Burkholderia arboris]